MTHEEFALEILMHLPFQANEQQMQVARALARFCARPAEEQRTTDRVFILNGYAGTGKTSLVGALVKVLANNHIPTMLMAPTGRAAKVFAASAEMPAATIHRKIYRHSISGLPGPALPRENKLAGGVFIVDEASMIPAADGRGTDLLGDLIQYVYSAPNCRLIFLGDTAQLPPVGQTVSPAMNVEVMHSMGLKVTRATLTEVARQGALSGILACATRLRRLMTAVQQGSEARIILPVTKYNDVSTVEAAELPELLDNLYRRDGVDQTVVITRANFSATECNRGIRAQVLDREEELTRGDRLIVAKNNYFWTRKIKGFDFVANGEILQIADVGPTEVKYGLRFATVTLNPVDCPNIEFTAKIMLDCLSGTAPALDGESMQRLYRGICADPQLHPVGATAESISQALRASEYWNALQVKYAYALTCHKAQGGQWANVIVDLSYIPPEEGSIDFLRWLYTAITRAFKHLYLISPPEAVIE